MFRRFLHVAVLFISCLAASALAAGAAEHAPLTVFAAASMKGSLDDVAQLYESRTGTKVSISFASSSALAKQIEAGAPADLYISADLKWMDYVVEKGVVNPQQVVKLLGNRIVLVAAGDSTLKLDIRKGFALADTLGDGRLAMGEVKSVPAGIYGKQALEYYGVWEQVAGKVAGAENVRAALKLVVRGEAPLGVVYQTDANAEPGVQVVGVFGEESHKPIVYPVAPVAASTNPAAQDFLSFLMSPEAQAVFKAAGFSVLAGS